MIRMISLAILALIVAACQSGGSTGGGSPIDSLAIGVAPPQVRESVVADAAPGTVPAVILMHGCAGVQTNTADWKVRFENAGWHVLIMDSHGPRGVNATCDPQMRGKGSTPLIRVGDAFSALDHLAAQPHIDPSRIYVMGWSEGAVVAGLAQTVPMLRYYDRDMHPNQFAGAISIAPHCESWTWNGKPLINQTLVVVGSADTWGTPQGCESFANNYRASDIRIHVIEGATHSFDIFRNRDGSPLNGHSTLGHQMYPSRAATEEAADVIGNFVDANL